MQDEDLAVARQPRGIARWAGWSQARFGLMGWKEKSGRAPLRLEYVDRLRFDQNPWKFCILLNRLPDFPLGIDLQNGNNHFSATQVAAKQPSH